MSRQLVPVLAVVAALVVGTPAHAVKKAKKADPAPPLATGAKIEPADAQALLREANELWRVKRDYEGALAKFNQAVEAAPNDGGVRLQRGHYFELLVDLVVPAEKKKFEDLAREDYKRVAADDPESIRGGVARDGLTRLSGTTLLEQTSVSCPKEAVEAHVRGESFYATDRFAEAAAEYERATTACPASAPLWVDHADAYFLMEQYDKAKELFTKALTLDPWSRSGHRFLADTEAKLSNGEAVIHQLELAVISDPVYEAAWSALRSYATAMGRKWTRVYGDKTSVTFGPDSNGKHQVNISVPRESTTDPKSGDGALWIGYGAAKANIFSGNTIDTGADGKPVTRKVDPKSMSALEIEREAVKVAFQIEREVAASGASKASPFWSMMNRAHEGGFLDEAIFLHLLDAPLAAEYPAFRDKNADRLVTYLDTVIVP